MSIVVERKRLVPVWNRMLGICVVLFIVGISCSSSVKEDQGNISAPADQQSWSVVINGMIKNPQAGSEGIDDVIAESHSSETIIGLRSGSGKYR